MAVDAIAVIEQQLTYLKERSELGLLTETEAQIFSSLVKLRVIVTSKAVRDTSGDSLEGISTDELKQLIPLLS